MQVRNIRSWLKKKWIRFLIIQFIDVFLDGALSTVINFHFRLLFIVKGERYCIEHSWIINCFSNSILNRIVASGVLCLLEVRIEFLFHLLSSDL